jgi:hypothetical protein
MLGVVISTCDGIKLMKTYTTKMLTLLKAVLVFRAGYMWVIPLLFVVSFGAILLQNVEITNSVIPARGATSDSLDKIDIMLIKARGRRANSSGTWLAVPHAYLHDDLGNIGKKDGVERVQFLTLQFFYDTLKPTGLAFEKQKLMDEKIAKANRTGRQMLAVYDLKTNVKVSLRHGGVGQGH